MSDASRYDRTAIVDAHVHLYDSSANHYTIFERQDPTFEALVGDYSALPKNYFQDAYLRDAKSRQVDAVIWHEFISEDPIKEMKWAQQLAASAEVPLALVGLVDFLDSDLPERLETYRSLANVTAVRQHLGWDENNPLRGFAKRPDLMADPSWLKGLRHLAGEDLRCGLEVFAPQLPDLLNVVRHHPEIGFTIAVMDWPLDLSREGYERWKTDLQAVSRCQNTAASISAVECIFGMNWSEEQVRPWILSLVEIFGPERCMFGSHMPIDGLSRGFDRLYDAYERILAGFSDDERDRMFRRTALEWFRVPTR